MKKITVIATALLFLVGCKKDTGGLRPGGFTQTDPASKANAAKAARPITLVLTSSANPSSPALTCTMPGIPFGIANSGYFLHGYAAHLGTVNPETSMGLDGSCNLSASTLILSTTTAGEIVAANGDKITYTGDDQINLANIILNGATTGSITGLWTITGGTGRFAGATGSFQIDGIVDLTTPGGPSISFTGEGTITY